MDYNWDIEGKESPVTNQLVNPMAHLSIQNTVPQNSHVPRFLLPRHPFQGGRDEVPGLAGSDLPKSRNIVAGGVQTNATIFLGKIGKMLDFPREKGCFRVYPGENM